jgi:hypothetical protein
MAANKVPRLYHSMAVLLPDGRVVVARGSPLRDSSNHDQLTAEFYSPPYLFKDRSLDRIRAGPDGVWRHVPGDNHERLGDRDRVVHPARLADPRVDTS